MVGRNGYFMINLYYEKTVENVTFSTWLYSRSREKFRPSAKTAQSEHCEDLGYQNCSEMVSQIGQETDCSESVVLYVFVTLRSAFDTLEAKKKHCKIEARSKCLICQCQICCFIILRGKQGLVWKSFCVNFASLKVTSKKVDFGKCSEGVQRPPRDTQRSYVAEAK